MSKKLLLGYDIGSSSIKASLIDVDSGELQASASSPATEMKINSSRKGWAEQNPVTWWEHVILATRKMLGKLGSESYEISGIGISYQMHGLVLVDKNHEALRPAIIWCDSRAVEFGNKAFAELGAQYCLDHFLNSPGNFTASKLKWVRDTEPDVYARIYKIMLPGDYLAMKLTGEIVTTVSGMSEGIFWDFKEKKISEKLLDYYGVEQNLLPSLTPTFGLQGRLTASAAAELGLKTGIPISYRAGDQPNNALSLNVLNPGEIAATAGTSGVIYGVADKNICDPESRVNTFAHVNYTKEQPNVGVLLCINGTGIQYSWLKQNIFENRYSYNELNGIASQVDVGAEGVLCFPFGNGAERILRNRDIHGHFSGINFNIHGKQHLVRAAQEGIVFAFKYGFDIMKNIGMNFDVIKAGDSNLFQSKVFKETFVQTCNVALEIYNTDGAQGAARGAGIGINLYTQADAFKSLKVIERYFPDERTTGKYDFAYQNWKNGLESLLKLIPSDYI